MTVHRRRWLVRTVFCLLFVVAWEMECHLRLIREADDLRAQLAAAEAANCNVLTPIVVEPPLAIQARREVR